MQIASIYIGVSFYLNFVNVVYQTYTLSNAAYRKVYNKFTVTRYMVISLHIILFILNARLACRNSETLDIIRIVPVPDSIGIAHTQCYLYYVNRSPHRLSLRYFID